MSSPAPEMLAREAERAFSEARSGAPNSAWLAISLAAPRGLASHLMDARLSDYSSYFASGSGSGDPRMPPRDPAVFVGLGAAFALRLEGNSRFAQAESAISEAFSGLHAPPELMPLVRFFGGASFSPGRDGQGNCWGDFGDASFFLPRVLYVDDTERSLWILVAETTSPDVTLDLFQQALDGAPAAPHQKLRTLSRHESESPDSWDALIRSIQEQIGVGSAEKIVAARRVTLELSGVPSLSDILERMKEQAPLCARFALRVREKTFIGATPERLVLREGNQVQTEALAGSIGAGVDGGAQRLLESPKDQHEHAYVVHAIENSLRPFCVSLQRPSSPEVRRLRHVLHLRTPIRGMLRGNVHVLDLVQALHPTPAVGGLPRKEALLFIEQHERAERGWYAAPMGWINSSGEGEFVVALRSGLLHQNKCHLYAGAGIVAESNPGDEFVETELKLSGMLGALGVEHD